MTRLRPSDLKRVGGGSVHVYTSRSGQRMNWSCTTGQVTGSDWAGDFQLAGTAETATEAKRVYCDWFNRGERD